MSKLIRRALGVIVTIGVGVHVGHAIIMGSAEHAPSSQAALTVDDDLGVYTIPVSLGGGAPQTFIVDSGAASVVIPRSMLPKLIAEGRLSMKARPDKIKFTVADGRKVGATIYTLRSVTIAGHTIDDVDCAVTDTEENGLPLLGQTVLGRFNRWSIDNVHHTLTVA